MSPRLKKLIGLGLLVPGLALYLFAAASLGERLPDHALLRLIYSAVAGVAWVLPVRGLLRWVNRDPSQNGT
jgi:hypothetical protein